MKKTLFSFHNNIFALLSFLMPIFIYFFVSIYRFILIHLMNIQLIVWIIGIVGIILGILGCRNSRETKHVLMTKIISFIGILLGVFILYFGWFLRIRTMTGIIFSVQSYEIGETPFDYVGSLQIRVDLPADELVEQTVDSLEPVYIINIMPDTMVYKQIGKQFWEKSYVDKGYLEVGQHIQVDWDGIVWITEPAQADAMRITVLDQ